MTERYVILDLDGTLLFAEERSGSLMIPGRRRNSYMAPETMENLKALQAKCRIVLATGRSRVSTRSIIDSLDGQGVRISAATAENGGIWLGPDSTVFFAAPEWIGQAKRIEERMEEGVSGIIQDEFESCVALLKPDTAALTLLDQLTAAWNLEHRRLRDGNKLFILAPGVDKRHALEAMLGQEALQSAWGVGNDFNDLDWMREVELSAAPACAKGELLESVSLQNGLIATARGHDGINQILTYLEGMA